MSEGLEDFLRTDRRDFKNEPLDPADMANDPMKQFKKWLAEAIDTKVQEPYAVCLSTNGKDGFPSSRMVFFREMTETGLIFYTNQSSRKGRELEADPKVSLNFHWEALDRQINIKGKARKVNSEVSDTYFNSRPRESQIGAWASQQSELLEDREVLEKRIAALNQEYEGKEVPRPAHWGGYEVEAIEWEFWQGRASRLHDRIRYRKIESGVWITQRLNP